jgi:hypothetical protein
LAVGQAIRVSLETVQIVKDLPASEAEKIWRILVGSPLLVPI